MSINPLDESAIQPSSMDVRLGNQFIFAFHPSRDDNSNNVIDPFDEESVKAAFSDEHILKNVIMWPGDFVLGVTQEVITLGQEAAVQVDGKSSLGRLGIQIHLTAGFVDPGFSGPITLELKNAGVRPVRLTAGMFIGQLKFFRLDSPASCGYAGKYVGARGPQVSKYYLNERPQ